jgi:hypothetical protein
MHAYQFSDKTCDSLAPARTYGEFRKDNWLACSIEKNQKECSSYNEQADSFRVPTSPKQDDLYATETEDEAKAISLFAYAGSYCLRSQTSSAAPHFVYLHGYRFRGEQVVSLGDKELYEHWCPQVPRLYPPEAQCCRYWNALQKSFIPGMVIRDARMLSSLLWKFHRTTGMLDSGRCLVPQSMRSLWL